MVDTQTSERNYYLKELATTTIGTNRPDLFRIFYLTNSTVKRTQALDIFKQYLKEQGITQVNLEDAWYAYLKSLGYTGTVTDMEYQFYNAND